jgi:AAA domain/UvrD-like helicase C-terminal domain
MTQFVPINKVIAACNKLNVDRDYVIEKFKDVEKARLVKLAETHPRFKSKMTFCDAIKAAPYACQKLGEPKSDPVAGRDLAAAVFASGTRDRDRFCIWKVMNTKVGYQDHSGKLFVQRASAEKLLCEWGADGAIDLMVAHPKDNEMVTTQKLYDKQISINNFWEEATVIRDLSGSVLDGLDDDQRSAARSILMSGGSVLTAPGGTGKSWTISKIVTALKNAKVQVVCLTPTHKAKHNLLADVPKGTTVSTIQSYTSLLSKPEEHECQVPLDLFVIIDETSMVDVEVMGSFADAMLKNARRWQVCLVGDDAQLQPVGRGEFFRQIIEECPEVVFRLTKCHRAKTAAMFDFHLGVRNGSLLAGDGSVVDVRLSSDDEGVLEAAKAIVSSEGAGIQYLTWKTDDVSKINLLVQEKVTGEPSAGKPFNQGDAVVYVGDNKGGLTKALCGVFVKYGKVKGDKKNKAFVDWDHGVETSVDIYDLQLAYCLTVHKAQGSGFERVCVVCTSMRTMLYLKYDRRWLYTAVSRAKEELIVLCTPDAAALAACAPGGSPRSVLDFRT